MKYLRWIGLALSLVGIGFVISQLASYASDLGDFRPNLSQLIAFAILTIVYGAANIALAIAWRDLLEHCGSTGNARWAIRVFGVTQLAKYIPGNFFHLASRQTIGMHDGHDAGALLKSAVWEFGTLMLSAVAFGIWVTPLLLTNVSYTYAGVVFLATVLVISFSAQRYFSLLVMRAVHWYIGFLLLSGLLYFATLQLLVPDTSLIDALPGIVGAYIIAWLLGAITPGAPAGIGVREVVMFALLQSVVGQTELLVSIVISRVITAGGDILFYFGALWMQERRGPA
jgi:uncharacterized membrane protein YbhN (UPF0104 family)